MLRKTIYFFLTFIVAVSCDFLKEKHTTSLSDDLYDSEAMLENHINGIIGRFITRSSFTGEAHEYLSLCSGLIHHGINGTTAYSKPYYASIYKLTQYSTSPKNSSFFTLCYGIVNACNVLIDNLNPDAVDPAYVKEIEAEARFYRAYAMFRLVKVYGDCPIKLGASALDNVNQKRQPYFEVYKWIVDELIYCSEHMRSPERVEAVTPGSGRVNRYAATALLSSVYVTIGSLMTDLETNFWDENDPARHPDFKSMGIESYEDAYELALAEAEKLIPESGVADPLSPYRLADKYGDLFNWDPAYISSGGYTAYDNPERIFVLPITSTCDAWLAKTSLPLYPEGTFFQSEVSNSYNGRWRPSRWVFQKWCETYPGERKQTSTNDYYTSSSDPRLALTILYGSVLNSYTQKVTNIYPTVISSNNAKSNAFPYFRKHWSRNYRHDGGEADSYMIRLAEVYLNAAEAAAELGMTQKACDYIECLHARARRSVPDGEPESEMPKWTSVPEDLRTAIFWERVFEQYGEGHEYDNVHRWGATWISDNITKPKNEFNSRPEQAKFWQGGYVYPQNLEKTQYLYPTEISQVRQSLLYAYPDSELNYNNALTSSDQNPFWWGL